MKELVSVELVERVFRYVAIICPVAGLLLGGVIGWAFRRPGIGTRLGIAVGCAGLLNYVLWRLSGAITGKLGLGSVANLLIQAAMFLALGFAAGVMLGGFRRAGAPENLKSEI